MNWGCQCVVSEGFQHIKIIQVHPTILKQIEKRHKQNQAA